MNDWLIDMDKKFVIKTKNKREYICELSDDCFGVLWNINEAKLFDSIEKASTELEKYKGNQKVEDYEIIQFSWDIVNAEEDGDDTDYERAIMGALRKGDGDRFGL